MAILIDGLFRANDLEDIHISTSVMNWVFFAVLVSFSVLIWMKIYLVCYFICPLLTIITFYYYTFQDFTQTLQMLNFNFLGKLESDKAFHKWLKIFETFIEGIALIRNNYILYSNQNLLHMLEIQTNEELTNDPKNLKLQRKLVATKIKPYSYGREKPKNQASNVWTFLAKNEKGGTFELTSRSVQYDEENSSSKKYITLNQVNVNVAGARDKLLIVRDVSHLVYLEQIMQSKQDMSKFTDKLMKQIQEYAEHAFKNLDNLQQNIKPQGKQVLQEAQNELKKMLFRIKDFEQVYNVSENKFESEKKHFNIKQSIHEVINVTQTDLRKRSIELSFFYDNDLPTITFGDAIKFKQILLNLLLQSISGTQKGIVRIKAERFYQDSMPFLKVETDNSKFNFHKENNQRIWRFTQLFDFPKLIAAKVEINLKIAKILCNALNWRIDFNAFKGSKYSVAFPLIKSNVLFTESLENLGSQLPNQNRSSTPQLEEQLENITPTELPNFSTPSKIRYSREIFNDAHQLELAEEDVIREHNEEEEDDEEFDLEDSNQLVVDKRFQSNHSKSKRFSRQEYYPDLQISEQTKVECCKSVLLYSLPDLFDLFKDQVGIICDEAQKDETAINLIRNSYGPKSNCSCIGYKYIFFDLDDPTIDQNGFILRINRLMAEFDKFSQIIGVTLRETITAENICGKLAINFIQRPPQIDYLKRILIEEE
ncbi:multi-sensor hybrid histidine kinase [Stylonychia lemnae]|uniref:Multi-sensor hybrid histidine kinase n=1 Tax=Stylonychia lemnae TaxID=5949 RepID=A0A078AH74_STYLE|nr:multi-sensor hybrid histidine kinase [Stylonychia lemnae]|eukprot:CDW81635.1 multi-sensor hybrid histidine kinase [Stylonychia lemnae]